MMDLDRDLFYLINLGLQNGFLDWLMPLVTEPNNWAPFGFLLAAALILIEPKKGIAVIGIGVFATLVSDATNQYLLKDWMERTRPCGSLPDVHLLVGCSQSFSFPSSHAVNVFALATVIVWNYRNLLIPALICTGLVSLSRVYVGVHYPSDVLGGMVVGILIGLTICLLQSKVLPIPAAPRTGTR